MIPRKIIEKEERVSYQSPDWKPECHILDSGTLWCIIHGALCDEIRNAGAIPGKRAAKIEWDAENDGFVIVKAELDVNGMASLIEFYVGVIILDVPKGNPYI